MARNLLTQKEVAARLGVSERTVYRERITGHLTYIQRKPGGKVYITEDAIAAYLARATHEARPELKLNQGTYRRRRTYQ